MVINEKGLCKAMAEAYRKKNAGYKVALRHGKDEELELVIAGPGWVATFNRENAPRKVLALIVEHLGDLPKLGEAFQVEKKAAQAEILHLAIPELPEGTTKYACKRTQITYSTYRIWQRVDDRRVYMLHPEMEGLLETFSVPVSMEKNGMLYAGGCVSQIYLTPFTPMENDKAVLNHLAKMMWV